jgi:hypothetical protein
MSLKKNVDIHETALVREELGMLGEVGGVDDGAEAVGEGFGVAGGHAGGVDGLADDEFYGAGFEGVDVDGEHLVGTDEGKGDEGDLGLDGHPGGSGEHGLELTVEGATAFRKDDHGHAGLEGARSPGERGDAGAGGGLVDGDLAGAVEIPADEGDLPERSLGEDAELEGELGEDYRRVVVAEVVAGVDGGGIQGKALGVNERDG